MKLSSVLRGRRSIPEPPGYDPSVGEVEQDDLSVSYDGDTYRCRVVSSVDGNWRVAYGRRISGDQSRAFVFSGDTLAYSVESDRPMDADVAMTGAAVLLMGGAYDGLDGRIAAFDSSGRELLKRELSVNPQNCVIAPEGNIAAVVTRPPDVSVLLIDLEEQSVRAVHDVDDVPVQLLGFTYRRNNELLYVAEIERDDPYFALGSDGSVVWKSRRYRNTQPFSRRVRNWISSFGTVEKTQDRHEER